MATHRKSIALTFTVLGITVWSGLACPPNMEPTLPPPGPQGVPGEQGGRGGQGPRRLAPGVQEQFAFSGQAIQMGGGLPGIAVAPQVIGLKGVDHHQDDSPPGGRSLRRTGEHGRQCREEQEGTGQRWFHLLIISHPEISR